MKKNTYIRLVVTAIAVLFAAGSIGVFVPPQPVQADLLTNIQDSASTFGGSGGIGLPENKSDPIQLIANALTVVLGFLGVIFLILVIYAGLLWMTAMGDPGKVKKAQGIIRTAAIGLAVIILALAIVQFVTYIISQSVA